MYFIDAIKIGKLFTFFVTIWHHHPAVQVTWLVYWYVPVVLIKTPRYLFPARRNTRRSVLSFSYLRRVVSLNVKTWTLTHMIRSGIHLLLDYFKTDKMGTPAFHSHCCIKIHFVLRKQINLWHEIFNNIFIGRNPHYSCYKNTIHYCKWQTAW